MSLQEWRDVIIIASGSLLILVLLALFIFTVVLGLATRALLAALQTLVKGELTPLADSLRHTLYSVQGTTAFIGETAVTPVIRVYGVVAGARRAAGVLSGVARRNRKR